MAIYSTFFLCEPDELPRGFPEWRLPLPHPVKRQVTNPFTKKTYQIETCAPEWAEEDLADQPMSEARMVVAVRGSYEDYLEGRLPAFIRSRPHWCAKGLTSIELSPLGKAIGYDAGLEDALYCPPKLNGGMLQRFSPGFVVAFAALDDRTKETAAQRWAETMSDREHTHSSAGRRVKPDMSLSDAMCVLRPLVGLAAQSSGTTEMYLLTEW